MAIIIKEWVQPGVDNNLLILIWVRKLYGKIRVVLVWVNLRQGKVCRIWGRKICSWIILQFRGIFRDCKVKLIRILGLFIFLLLSEIKWDWFGLRKHKLFSKLIKWKFIYKDILANLSYFIKYMHTSYKIFSHKNYVDFY